MRHQFGARGHVDAVDVGMAHRRSGRGQVDLDGAGVTRHLHDFLGGGAAHDGVVHQQHLAALELAADGVELLAHGFLARGLARHDEGAAHVAVLDKAFAVGNAQQLGQLHGAGPAGFRNRDDGVDLVGRHGGDHALGQRLAHVQAGLVDGDAIQHGVRAGQVHVLEHAGVQLALFGALAGFDLAVAVHEHGFTRSDIALELVQRAFQGHGFAGQHHRAVGAAAHAQGTDAEGVAEGQQAVARNQRDHGVRALDALVHGADGLEDVFALERRATAGAGQLVGQHVEQDFGVALGVGVAVVGVRQLLAQLLGIGEVAVVHHDDAEGRVHVEGLGLFLAGRVAGRRVAHLTQAHRARQGTHVAGAEHVAHHALGLVHEELALLLGHDAGGILATVLQQQQGVIDQLIHGRGADYTNDSTHSCVPSVCEGRPSLSGP